MEKNLVLRVYQNRRDESFSKWIENYKNETTFVVREIRRVELTSELEGMLKILFHAEFITGPEFSKELDKISEIIC